MWRRAAVVFLAAVLIAELVGATLLIAGPRPTGREPDVTVIGGRSVHLVDASGGTASPLLGRIRSGMGPAIDAVQRFWGPDWTDHIEVVATGSASQFVAEAGLDPNRRWDDIAAVAVADEIDVAAHRAGGQRIVFAPGAAGMSDPALQLVLTHELFHLAARAETAVDAPRWLTEGVADFVARPAAALPPDAAADPALPGDADLDQAGPARSAGYDRAWWFARFVSQEYGTDALLRLYRRACGPGHPDFAAAVTGALGTDMAGLQARWVRWLSSG